MTAILARAPRSPAWAASLAILWAGWMVAISAGQTNPETNPVSSEATGNTGPQPAPPELLPMPADGALSTASSSAASGSIPAPPAATENPPASAPLGTGLVQTGCSSCGNGLLAAPSSSSSWPPTSGADGCTEGPCIPGRQMCHPCVADSALGRAACALYECICCPDPCYEPRWTPVADSAFFVDAARPQSQMRLRWDEGLNLILPDRSEYFWPRADGSGKGPKPVGPFKADPSIRYNELSMYTETGIGGFSMITEMPYLSIDPSNVAHSSGFGDIMIGTKSLLYDCELLQLGFEFKTYILSGNFRKGLGTGHMSLEPSVLMGVKLAPETFFQGQVSEWVPLGGDPSYAGSILHFHMSLNQVLFRILPDVPLIGTLEFNGWAFQDGAYTDPILGPFQKSAGTVYLSPGAGLRLFICDKVDIGFGAEISITKEHFAEELFRTEVRWRF